MAKKHLTQEQKKEIIASKLNNHQLGEIYEISHRTISAIRCRAGAGVGRETGGNFKLTKEQIAEIIISDLTNVELAKIYSITPQHLSKIRRKHGVARFKAENGTKEKKEPKYRIRKVTSEIKAIICDPYLSADEAHVKTGISKNRIWEIRKKEKIRHIKSTIVKISSPKEHTDKVKLQASMSYDEQNYLLRKKAKESSKQNNDDEKIANGTHEWQIISDRGIKARVLRRIAN